MEKATVLIEITATKTEVVVTGTSGKEQKLNITGTGAEKVLNEFLNKLRWNAIGDEISNAIDLKNWQEV